LHCSLASFSSFYLSFFFNHTPTTEIYTLSLHDALPISLAERRPEGPPHVEDLAPRSLRENDGLPALFLITHPPGAGVEDCEVLRDRKSTRLNSSHVAISYAVFCLKKKKKKKKNRI